MTINLDYYYKRATEYYNKGDYTNALECFLELKDIWERQVGKYKEHSDYVLLLNVLGSLYHDTGDYTRAEKFFLESKAIWEKVSGRKESPDYVALLDSLGKVYQSNGDFTRAEECFFESKDIIVKLWGEENPNCAVMINTLGVLYYVMGDYNCAEEFFLESKAIWEKVSGGKESPDYGALLNNLGALYKIKGDYTRAEEFFLESKNISEKQGKNNYDYVESLNSMGVLCRIKGDYTHAEEFFLESKDILERLTNKEHPSYIPLLHNLGVLYHYKGDYARAEECLLESKARWERVLGKEHYSYSAELENLYLFYLSMGKYKQAVAYKEEANQHNTSLVNRVFSFLPGRERETYWNDISSSFESSYSLSWFHPIPESNALNYNNALFTKGLLLRTTNAVRDSINAMRDSIKSSGDQNLIEQYNEFSRLRRQIGNLQQRKDRNEAYIKNLEDQAEKLDKSLTQASAAFREFKIDLTLNWQNVQDTLKPEEAAIEFVSFKLYDGKWTSTTKYAALVLRSCMDAPEWVPLPHCEETVSAFLKKQNENTSSEQEKKLYDENGSALYAAVWQPLEKTLEGVISVYYSPSGLLHKISFNAIPVKEGLPLTDVYDLNLASSTREIVYRGRKKQQRPDSGVIYSGLIYTMDDTETQEKTDLPDILREGNLLQLRWRRLPYSEKEGIDIKKILTEKSIPVDLYSEEKGNKESFINLDGKKKNILHISTHGLFLGDIEKNYGERERLERLGGGPKIFKNPLLRSGLIMAGCNNAWKGEPVAGVGNGVLFADDVAEMDLLGAQLVALSACNTALGEINDSEGVFGLQRAFKLAGAETLIVSLWNVSDEATSILMTSFYEKWLSGKGKQEAFKYAQKQLRANPEYSSPFYWASFVMID
jgi:CHAT domain-containing protein